MTQLEDRFQRAAAVEGYGAPDLGSIAARGHKRAHNKRVVSGLASVAVLAVGSIGLVTSIDRSSGVVDAADGSLAVDLGGNDDDDVVSLSETEDAQSGDEQESTADQAEQGTDDPSGGAAEPVDGQSSDNGAGETEIKPQPIIDSLTDSSELCFDYDNESGAGVLGLTLGDDGNVLIDERRDRGSASDPGFVFQFRGAGRADGLEVRASGGYQAEGLQSSSEETRTYVFTEDLTTAAGPDFIYTKASCDAVGPVEDAQPAQLLDDGYGGSLTVDDATGILHQRADGSVTAIELPAIEADVVQRWPTDVAPVDGTFYLFIDQFVSLPPGPGEADHFEVSILALNLETDELLEVERRVITNVDGPEWIYNGHITSNGELVLVMREFWQSTCLYAEALTMSGTSAEAPELDGLERPQWIDALTDEVQSQLQTPEGRSQLGCVSLEEIGDGGVLTLGRRADSAAFADFAADFLLLFG